MNDREMIELLRLVDEQAGEVPSAFDAELWSDLQRTLHRTPGSASAATGAVLIGLDGAEVTKRRRLGGHSGLARVLTAAAALAAFVVGGLLLTRRAADTPALSDPVVTLPTSTVPRLTDPLAACERFVATGPDLNQLARTIDDVDASSDLDAAVVATSIYAADLAAAGSGEATVATADRAVSALDQAVIELAAGALDRARGSIEFAISTLGADGLTDCSRLG